MIKPVSFGLGSLLASPSQELIAQRARKFRARIRRSRAIGFHVFRVSHSLSFFTAFCNLASIKSNLTISSIFFRTRGSYVLKVGRKIMMQRKLSLWFGLLVWVSSVWSSDGFPTTAAQRDQSHWDTTTACSQLYASDGDADTSQERVQKIMYQQHTRKRESMRYQIIASKACEKMARRMEEVRRRGGGAIIQYGFRDDSNILVAEKSNDADA